MSTQAFEIVSGTLPVDFDGDLVHELPAQVQVGWLILNREWLPLYNGCSVVGRASGGGITKTAAQREADWCTAYNRATVHGVFVDDLTISSSHLMIDIEPDGSSCLIRDLRSLNKTRLGTNPSTTPLDPTITYSIKSGDALMLGRCIVRIEFGHPDSVAQQPHQQQNGLHQQQSAVPQQRQQRATQLGVMPPPSHTPHAAAASEPKSPSAAATSKDMQQSVAGVAAAGVRSPRTTSPRPVSVLQALQRLQQQEQQQPRITNNHQAAPQHAKEQRPPDAALQPQQQPQASKQAAVELHQQSQIPQQQQHQQQRQLGDAQHVGPAAKIAAFLAGSSSLASPDAQQLLALTSMLSPAAAAAGGAGSSHIQSLVAAAGFLLQQQVQAQQQQHLLQQQQQQQCVTVSPAAPGLSAASAAVVPNDALLAAAAAMATVPGSADDVGPHAAAVRSSMPAFQETPDSAAVPAAVSAAVPAAAAAAEPTGAGHQDTAPASAPPATAAATAHLNPALLQLLLLHQHGCMPQPRQQQLLESQGFTGTCTPSGSEAGQTQTPADASLGREDWWADERIVAGVQQVLAANQALQGAAATEQLSGGNEASQGADPCAHGTPATARGVRTAEQQQQANSDVMRAAPVQEPALGCQKQQDQQCGGLEAAAAGHGQSPDNLLAGEGTSGANNALHGSQLQQQGESLPQQQQGDSLQLHMPTAAGDVSQQQEQGAQQQDEDEQRGESLDMLLIAGSPMESEQQQQEQQEEQQQQQHCGNQGLEMHSGVQEHHPIQATAAAAAPATSLPAPACPQSVPCSAEVDIVPATQDYTAIGLLPADAAAAARDASITPAGGGANALSATEVVLATQQLLPGLPVAAATVTAAPAVITAAEGTVAAAAMNAAATVAAAAAAAADACESSETTRSGTPELTQDTAASGGSVQDEARQAEQQQQQQCGDGTEEEQDLIYLMLMRAAANQQEQQQVRGPGTLVAAAEPEPADHRSPPKQQQQQQRQQQQMATAVLVPVPGLTQQHDQQQQHPGQQPGGAQSSAAGDRAGQQLSGGCVATDTCANKGPQKQRPTVTTAADAPLTSPTHHSNGRPSTSGAAAAAFACPVYSSQAAAASPLCDSQQLGAAFDAAGMLAGQLFGGQSSSESQGPSGAGATAWGALPHLKQQRQHLSQQQQQQCTQAVHQHHSSGTAEGLVDPCSCGHHSAVAQAAGDIDSDRLLQQLRPSAAGTTGGVFAAVAEPVVDRFALEQQQQELVSAAAVKDTYVINHMQQHTCIVGRQPAEAVLRSTEDTTLFTHQQQQSQANPAAGDSPAKQSSPPGLAVKATAAAAAAEAAAEHTMQPSRSSGRSLPRVPLFHESEGADAAATSSPPAAAAVSLAQEAACADAPVQPQQSSPAAPAVTSVIGALRPLAPGAAAAAAQQSPSGGIGFGTQLALEGLAELCRTPSSSDPAAAAADLRALGITAADSVADVFPVAAAAPGSRQQWQQAHHFTPHVVGQVMSHLGLAAAAAGRAGSGKSNGRGSGGGQSKGRGAAAASRGGRGGRGRGRGKVSGHGAVVDAAAAGDTAAATTAATADGLPNASLAAVAQACGGSGSGKRRRSSESGGGRGTGKGRSRSSTPTLDIGAPAGAVDALNLPGTAAAGSRGSVSGSGAASGSLRRSARSTAGKKQVDDDYVSGIEFSQQYHADMVQDLLAVHPGAAGGWGAARLSHGEAGEPLTAAAAVAEPARCNANVQRAQQHHHQQRHGPMLSSLGNIVSHPAQQHQDQRVLTGNGAPLTTGTSVDIPKQQCHNLDVQACQQQGRAMRPLSGAKRQHTEHETQQSGEQQQQHALCDVNHQDSVAQSLTTRWTATLEDLHQQQQQRSPGRPGAVMGGSKEPQPKRPRSAAVAAAELAGVHANSPVGGAAPATGDHLADACAAAAAAATGLEGGSVRTQEKAHQQQQQELINLHPGSNAALARAESIPVCTGHTIVQQPQQQRLTVDQQQQSPTASQHHAVKKLTCRKSSAVKPPQLLAAAGPCAAAAAAAAEPVGSAFPAAAKVKQAEPQADGDLAEAASPQHNSGSWLRAEVHTAAPAAVGVCEGSVDTLVTPTVSAALVQKAPTEHANQQDQVNHEELPAAAAAAQRSGKRRTKSVATSARPRGVSPAVQQHSTPAAAAAEASDGGGASGRGRSRRSGGAGSMSPATAAAIRAAAGYTPTRSSVRRAAVMAAAAAGGVAGSTGAGLQVVVSFASGVLPQQQEAGRRIVDSLGGRVSESQTDVTVTHLVAQKDRVSKSLKLLLAVARGVPVVNAQTWLNACKAAKSFVPVEGHLLDDPSVMQGYPAGCSLPHSYAAATTANQQGRKLLSGVHCLLSPGLQLGHDTAKNLRLLIASAGGLVLDSPQQLLQLAQQQGRNQHEQPQQQHLLVLVSSEKQSGQMEQVAPKDLSWANECGLPRCWPLYTRDWLIQSIMTYTVDWQVVCARVN